MFSYLSSLFLLLTWTGSSSQPHEHPDSVVSLPEITVTASRIHPAGGGPTLRITRIDPGSAGLSFTHDVGSLLAARSGGFIRQYGPGGLATLSLRGASPSQTLLLVDGHPIMDPQLGQVDLTLLPTAVLERVEVVHGSGGALYGSAGMAGVVNLQTLPSSSGSSYGATIGGGAFGRRLGTVRLAHDAGKLSGAVTAELVRTDNDFPYQTSIGGRLRQLRRRGADFQRGIFYATSQYAGDRHTVRLAGWRTRAQRGLPGPATLQPAGEHQWDDQFRLWASDRFALGQGVLRASAATQWSSLRYRNPQLEIDQTSRSSLHVAQVEHAGAQGPWSWTLGSSLDLGSARHPALSNAARIWHGAVFLAAGHLRWGLFPALRFDSFRAGGGRSLWTLSPHLGVRQKLLNTPFEAFGGIGRSFRAPTLNERYWQPGGNPDLRPERGWTFDAGLRGSRHPFSAEWSVFASIHRDEISWIRTGSGYFAPFNLRKTRAAGFEISVEATANPANRIQGQAGIRFVYTRAQDLSDPARSSYKQQLRYVPREQLKLHGSAEFRPFLMGTEIQYVGRRYVTTDGTVSIDPYLVADVQLEVGIPVDANELRLAAVLFNVLDARYHVIQHYPMPPRSLGVSITVQSRKTSF